MVNELAALNNHMRTKPVTLNNKAFLSVKAIFERLIDEYRTNNELSLIDAYLVTLCYEIKNAIPNDPESPFVTSGIRIGTPAITTRGFKQAEAQQVANLIADVLDKPEDSAVIQATKQKVHALTSRFPVYGS